MNKKAKNELVSYTLRIVGKISRDKSLNIDLTALSNTFKGTPENVNEDVSELSYEILKGKLTNQAKEHLDPAVKYFKEYLPSSFVIRIFYIIFGLVT